MNTVRKTYAGDAGSPSDQARTYFEPSFETIGLPQGPFRYLFPRLAHEAFERQLSYCHAPSLLTTLDQLEGYLEADLADPAQFLFLSIPQATAELGKLFEEELAVQASWQEKMSVLQKSFEPETPVEVEVGLSEYQTPTFDLHSVYGGPGMAYQPNPELYRRDDPVLFSFESLNPEMAMEAALRGRYAPPGMEKAEASASVTTLRKAHNLIIRHLREQEGMTNPEALFMAARQELSQLIQWLILHELLPQVLSTSAWDRILFEPWAEAQEGDRLEQQFMPLEIAAMAFRLGNTSGYKTFLGEDAELSGNAQAIEQLLGLEKRSPVDTVNGTPEPAHSSLHPKGGVLRWGYRFNLPSGQEMVEMLRQLGCSDIEVLSPREVLKDLPIPLRIELRDHELETFTPLWFYLHKESQLQENGQRLGQLGSWLVGQYVLWMVAHSPFSVSRTHWTPSKSRIPALKEIRRFDGINAWVK